MSIQPPYRANNQTLTTQDFNRIAKTSKFLHSHMNVIKRSSESYASIVERVGMAAFEKAAVAGVLAGGLFLMVSGGMPVAAGLVLFQSTVTLTAAKVGLASLVKSSIKIGEKKYFAWTVDQKIENFNTRQNQIKKSIGAELAKVKNVVECFLNHELFISPNAAREVQNHISLGMLWEIDYKHFFENHETKKCFEIEQKVNFIVHKIHDVLNSGQVELIPSKLRDKGIENIKREMDKLFRLINEQNHSIEYVNIYSCARLLRARIITDAEYMTTITRINNWYIENNIPI